MVKKTVKKKATKKVTKKKATKKVVKKKATKKAVKKVYKKREKEGNYTYHLEQLRSAVVRETGEKPALSISIVGLEDGVECVAHGELQSVFVALVATARDVAKQMWQDRPNDSQEAKDYFDSFFNETVNNYLNPYTARGLAPEQVLEEMKNSMMKTIQDIANKALIDGNLTRQ